MDINLLSKMVGELILRHDQIGIPGIGTFVAEMVPASFSDKGYTINPPYRHLNFIPSPLEQEILYRFYADTNKVDISTAKSTIDRFISELKVVLLDRRTIVLPGLGKLRVTKENTFFFVPDENLDICPEVYGLPSVSLKTHEETPEEIALSVSNLASIIESEIPEEQKQKINAFLEDDTSEMPAQMSQPDPQPAAKPELQPEPQPEAKPEAKPAAKPEAKPDSKPKRKKFRWWVPLLVIVGIAFIAFCAFMVLASLAPDFIDSILYTPEELRIINY